MLGFSCRVLEVLLQRGFLVVATTWLVALPLAALAAGHPAAPPAAYGFAFAVYSVGRVICHQLPVRSFHFAGMPLPVCARCTGIYVGAAAAAVLLRDSPLRTRANRYGGRARLILLLACAPTAATLAFEWSTGAMPANWIRALAGLPLGAAVAWAIAMVN
jgi:uncharacterized membrane protein